MRSLVMALLWISLLPAGAEGSVQKEKAQALCAVLETLYGKAPSLEAPFAIYYGINDWNDGPTGKSRDLPSGSLIIGSECDAEKASARVTLTSSSAIEKVDQGKLALGLFYGSMQKQLFTVNEKGEIKADITFITTVNTKDIPTPPSTLTYQVDIDLAEKTLVTDVVVDDLKTEKKSCYDVSVAPAVRVACRASQKTTVRRDGDKTVIHLDKSARFYDAEWNLLPNTGWKIGPEQVATSDWKEVQAAYLLRTAP